MVKPNKRETMGKKLKRLNRLCVNEGYSVELKEMKELNEYREELVK